MKDWHQCCVLQSSICNKCRNIFVCPFNSTQGSKIYRKECALYEELPNPLNEIVNENTTRSLYPIKEAKNRLLQEKIESDNRQISAYDAELREAKRLLKAAVEDMYNSVNDVHCKYCSKWHTDQCQGTSHLDCYIENKFKWRYADEALALIGGTDND